MGKGSVEHGRLNGGISRVSRLNRGLRAACLSALALLLSCGDAVVPLSPAGSVTISELEHRPGPVVESLRPALSAMNMVRQDAPSAAVATERAPHLGVEPPAAVRAPQPAEAVTAPVPADRTPITTRTARQRLTVRIAPHHGAPIRARIPRGESFEVFERVEGRECGGQGWADIGNGDFVCLENSRRSTTAPRPMPHVQGEGVLPYYFAKIPPGASARRWTSLRRYHAGDEPEIVTAPGRDFAFRSRLRAKGQIVLVDTRGRVMPEQDLQRFRPSGFEGRDLLAQPVPPGQRLAWAVQWPETTVYSEADAGSALAPSLDYHAEVYVQPKPVRSASGTFYALADGAGFVSARNLRRLAPVPSLEEPTLAEGETWIDVDLERQILTVMEGSRPVYATLVSTGKKGLTPRGLFRINKKQAVGSMSSQPGAADPYAVEAVPYVQYFHGGIALHSAYWHSRFGFRVSHGCVNLSPRDAAWVYSRTGPHPRDGWMEVFEDEGDLGTRVRVREGDAPVADRRGPVEHRPG